MTKVLGKNVMIQWLFEEETKTSGGIIVMNDKTKEQRVYGIVQAIGKDVKSVNVGDKVYYAKYQCHEVAIARDKTIHITNELNIECVIED